MIPTMRAPWNTATVFNSVLLASQSLQNVHLTRSTYTIKPTTTAPSPPTISPKRAVNEPAPTMTATATPLLGHGRLQRETNGQAFQAFPSEQQSQPRPA